MFIKFLQHDLKYGVFAQKGRLLLTFLIFFFLSSFHFLTLRIYEITNPAYFEQPSTTADYFLSLIGGCGKVEYFSLTDNTFTMPVIWMVFALWMLFVSLYYPYLDLEGIGKHLIVLSGQRKIWWFSKCVWAVANAIINYLIIFVASTLAGLCFGAKLSMQANHYLFRELDMQVQYLTTSTVWNIWPIFLLTGFVLIALSLFELALSTVIKPLLSYLLLSGYLFAGAYLQSPALMGNYMMPARNQLLVTTGLSMGLGYVITTCVIMASTLLGFWAFQHMDILGRA